MNNLVLDYIFKCNTIPVWIVDKHSSLNYSSLPSEMINEKAGNIFSYFAKYVSTGVNVAKLNESELFAYFRIDNDEKILIAGPAFILHPLYIEKTATTALTLLNPQYFKRFLLETGETSSDDFCQFIAALASLYGLECPSSDRLLTGVREVTLKQLIDKQLIKVIFDIREEERLTAYAPELEARAFEYVKRGDSESLKRNFKYPLIRDSNAKKTKHQYLFEAVAMVTLATRVAVSSGVDVVKAYSLSDLYLKKLSDSTSDKEISSIIAQVLPHFASFVKEAKDKNVSVEPSPYIAKAIQFIRTHLHYPISLKDAAECVGLSEKYLSRLFATSLGEKFSACVQRERINEAKSLLENSEMPIVEISTSLSFSSESYFIKIFTKYEGITPRKYRDKTYLSK